MAIRPDAVVTPIGEAPIATPTSGGSAVGSGNTQTPISSTTSTSTHTQTTTPIPVAEAPITPRVGASVISENPLDVVPKTTTPAVIAVVVDDVTKTKTPSTPVADAIKNVTQALGGGGGGGGGASSEEGGATEEPKKPNYLVLGLLGLGAYFLLKKLF